MKPIATLLTTLSILSVSILLGGCSGGEGTGNSSAQATHESKPVTPESTAAATKHYSQDINPTEP